MSKVVVVVPTYNEAKNINKMIDVLEKDIFPKITNNDMWLLVVDDKSPDGTADVVKEKQKKYKNIVLSLGNKQGLGAAYKRGMKYAMEEMGADAVIEFDADFQHPPKYIIELVKKFDEGFDHIIGSRAVKGGTVPEEWGLFRKALTKFGGLFTRVVLFFPKINVVKDTSTGLKLTRTKEVLDKIDFKRISNGFFYKTQILYQLVKNKAKIVEIPLEFKLREEGESKMTMKDIIGTFVAVVILRLKDPDTIHFIKFGTVGFIGYLINALGLEMFFKLGFAAGIAAALGAEGAIISNFILNNFWTFKGEKITGAKKIISKFLQFNLTSLGAVAIQGVAITILVNLFGEGLRQVYLILVIGFLVIPYNYTMYNVFIWKRWKVPFLKKIQEKI